MDQRQRRQQSIPTTFEASIPTFSAADQQIQSFDQFRSYPQDERILGTTNTGHPQHYLQEAQQHCQAQPGQQQGHIHSLDMSQIQFRQLQHRQLEAQLDSQFGMRHMPQEFHNQHVVKIERSRSNVEGFRGPPYTGVPTKWEPEYPKPTSAVSDMAGYDWRASLPQEMIPQARRAFTPPLQSTAAYFPVTPATGPYGVLGQAFMMRADAGPSSPSDNDPDATIKPVRKRSQHPARVSIDLFEAPETFDASATFKPLQVADFARSNPYSNLFPVDQMNIHTELLPSPPNTAPIKSSRKFDVALMPNHSLDDMPKLELLPPHTPLEMFHDHSGSANASPYLSSVPHSPSSSCDRPIIMYTPLMPDGSDFPDHMSSAHVSRSSMDFGPWDSPTRYEMSPQEALMDMGIDATVEDTGISAEEVQAFIGEQNPVTLKWTCMYPDCGKLFGRKENIRSHVQTHLGDRQFKCGPCGKRFVRQHDLKRHSKIHSGAKPYSCRCGNSFARHDALTRHRQRGICNGGFSGVVKKLAKRGRPRKERPNDDERTDKAARTRKHANDKSYASSVSETSASDFTESPSDAVFDNFETEQTQARTDSDLQVFSFPPNVFSHTPPTSPYSTGDRSSPQKARSLGAALTPSSSILDDEQDAAVSAVDTSDLALIAPFHDSHMGSQVGSPPELSHSSPPSSTRLLDLDLASVLHISGSEHQSHETKEDADADSFDLFNLQSSDNAFDTEWTSSNYLNFDKESNSMSMEDYNAGFNDEALFSENCDNNVYY